ncbi:MAG TPA: hypothetical protein VJS69_01225 [Candidatus Krumholzibacteria bacterium]|nr:hypothetical protein [Candidatus Krumholzibacteria bacterium]
MPDFMPPERAAVLFHEARHAIELRWEGTPIAPPKVEALTRLERNYAAALAEIVTLRMDVARLCDERNEQAARRADAEEALARIDRL